MRAYLDWNATAPLRDEARVAMAAAMDVVGNPSSVHAEGRAAKGLIEKARVQVAELVGCEPGEIVFTSGATEAAHLVLNGTGWADIAAPQTEHDCILANIPEEDGDPVLHQLPLDEEGRAILGNPNHDLCAVGLANGETGIVNDLNRFCGQVNGDVVSDITQGLGKIDIPAALLGPLPTFGARFLIGSAHKLGGPKGVGFAAFRGNTDQRVIRGGGQEQGRRSGTENIIGIAGFGAAAEAARKQLNDGLWAPVAELRNLLENRLADEAPETIFVGKGTARLPNTSCFAVPGWKGETQVMQMDLAGFAISAGSACSSGKVKSSRVLKAMGFDDQTASSAIRVSIGPLTTEAELMRFADAWLQHYKRRVQKAA